MTLSDKKNKIFCSYGYASSANWLVCLPNFEITKNIKEADVVLFGGGEDINPKLYRENKSTKVDYINVRRDAEELADFMIAKERGIKMVGICRGAQLLCALSGGKLIQHVTNHHGDHRVKTHDNKSYLTNSIHHQMMFPYTMNSKDYTMIAWSSDLLSTTYIGGNNKEVLLPGEFKEPEVIHFKNTKSLAVQFHPEMMFRNLKVNSPAIEWIQLVFSKFYNNEL